MGVFGIFRIVLVMLLWAICYPLILVGFAYAPLMTFAALRAFLSGAVLVAAGMALGRPWPRGRRIWLTLAAIGMGATSLAYLGMFHAAEFVSPGIATVIGNAQPLLAAVLASMFLGEHMGKRGKLGLALGFAGIVFIALPQLLTTRAETYLIGIGYIVLAALGITISNVLIRYLAPKVDALMAMGCQMLIGGVPLLVVAFALEQPMSVVWAPQFLLTLAGLSLFGSALAYWLWNLILKETALNVANAFSFLVPVFGLSMGALFFSERLGWFEAIGIALTLAGIALASRDKPAGKAAGRAKEKSADKYV